MKFIFCYVIFTLCFEYGYLQLRSLGSYGADKSQVSVSGFSSGASMATQYHVAFSSEVMGAGIIAGASYYCAGQLSWLGLAKCWFLAIPMSIPHVRQIIKSYTLSNLVDPPENMARDKVYILNGRRDILVSPANGPHILKFYQYFDSDILTEFSIDAQHGMPTADYGLPCKAFQLPFVTNCSYNAAYMTLNHIYGHLIKPTTETAQSKDNLYKFNQFEFTNGFAKTSSMDSVGYVYVPSFCQINTGCRLHIAHHGCFMGRKVIGEEFVRHAGYNDVAELNNIIILYPQIAISLWAPFNPLGCYDWFGFTGPLYATKSGIQMQAIHNMMQRILS